MAQGLGGNPFDLPKTLIYHTPYPDQWGTICPKIAQKLHNNMLDLEGLI
jgi:hypothetical protein